MWCAKDGHAADGSFPSFELLEGSGVVSSYDYAPDGDDNQSLGQTRWVDIPV